MKKIIFTLLVSTLAVSSFAQQIYSSSGKPLNENNKTTTDDDEEKGFNPNNMVFGGGFTFGIGGGVTNIGISPILGYRFTERFAAGIGLGYEYLSVKNFLTYQDQAGALRSYTLKTSIYSGSVWARYIIWQNVFLHVEPEMILWNKVNKVYLSPTNGQLVEEKDNLLVPRVLVGGGLRQPISDRVSFLATALYDIIQDPNSPYNGFDIRFGIVAGF
jgi:hypothetical protein